MTKTQMLYEVLEILAQQVENHLNSFNTGNQPPKEVNLENISQLDSGSGQGALNGINLTLINLSEENTMKNFPNLKTVGTTTQIKQPVINLNLYALFSINMPNSYDIALSDLSKIIQFFQGKKVFTQSNSTYNHTITTLQGIDNFKFHVDLYTPTFEEQNYIWGSLGGRQLPSALYKISVIQIESDEVQNQAGIVTETNQNINQM